MFCPSQILHPTFILLSLLFFLHLSYCSPLEFICKIFCVMTWIFLTWEWIPWPRYALIGRIGGNPAATRTPHALIGRIGGTPRPAQASHWAKSWHPRPRSLLIGCPCVRPSSGRSRQRNAESPPISWFSVFSFKPLHIIPFWNPYDLRSLIKLFSTCFKSIRMNRMIKKVQKL